MFLRDPEGQTSSITLDRSEAIILLVLVIPTLLFGLYFGPLVDLANASVQMFGIR
jgi:NADH:ubiquinone oxidoreductase subunit 4 (subunit M)